MSFDVKCQPCAAFERKNLTLDTQIVLGTLFLEGLDTNKRFISLKVYLSEGKLFWCVRVPVELSIVDAANPFSEAPLSPPVGIGKG